MGRARDRAEHAGHTYEDQMFSDEDIERAQDIQCIRCKTGGLHWGDYYGAKGDRGRRLFTESNRLHKCGPQPDADAFDVVAE